MLRNLKLFLVIYKWILSYLAPFDKSWLQAKEVVSNHFWPMCLKQAENMNTFCVYAWVPSPRYDVICMQIFQNPKSATLFVPCSSDRHILLIQNDHFYLLWKQVAFLYLFIFGLLVTCSGKPALLEMNNKFASAERASFTCMAPCGLSDGVALLLELEIQLWPDTAYKYTVSLTCTVPGIQNLVNVWHVKVSDLVYVSTN